MSEPARLTLADEFAAAVAWWRDAGLDHDYHDDVTEWLAEPQEAAAQPADAPSPRPASRPAEPPAAEPPQKIGGPPESWPSSLDGFARWWLEDASIDSGGIHPRIAPHGPAGAQLMVIVPEPEIEDSETPLSGPQGRFLHSILRACGIAPQSVYFSCALARHTPLADWQTLQQAGLGELLAHHIALAAPERILALGANILPLLRNESTQDAANLRSFNHDGRRIPLMMSKSLATLQRTAGARRAFWQNWLEFADR